MTLEELKNKLRMSGSNTKGEILSFLEKPTKQGILELIKDLQEVLRKLEVE